MNYFLSRTGVIYTQHLGLVGSQNYSCNRHTVVNTQLNPSAFNFLHTLLYFCILKQSDVLIGIHGFNTLDRIKSVFQITRTYELYILIHWHFYPSRRIDIWGFGMLKPTARHNYRFVYTRI